MKTRKFTHRILDCTPLIRQIRTVRYQGVHTNGAHWPDRTFILTYSATDTQRRIHDRQQYCFPVSNSGFNLDGLLRDRAMFLADKALLIIGPGNAQRVIDLSHAEPGGYLFCFRKAGNRPRRTYLCAQGTQIFAIADLRHQPRSPDTLCPGLQHHWLQAVGDTDLHAITATDTSIKELVFAQRPRRTNNRADKCLLFIFQKTE